MKRETYSKGMQINAQERGNKTINIKIDAAEYAHLIEDNVLFKSYLQDQASRYPELFPDLIQKGEWSLNGYVPASAKQNIKQRRIITSDGQVWQIHPSFLMPYMTCKTAEASKYLRLLNWCPYWAMAEIFGKDPMFYYRLHCHFGGYNIVGTTVKKAEKMPKNVLADEKHATISGEKVYAAVTCGQDCILGASVSPTASENDLTLAYGQFKKEALHVSPDYQPETVNTDGWSATINAWKTLFDKITVIRCFLHAVLKIKNVATKATRTLYDTIVEKAWNAYKAETKISFSQRIRRLSEYAKTLDNSKLKTSLLKLCSRKSAFMSSYDFDKSHRTSNMIDRLINRIDRRLIMGKWWRGSLSSAEKGLRAFCLIQNFSPYCPSVQKKYGNKSSAFERLNGCNYSDDWVENLLISTSIQKKYTFQQNPL